MVVFPSMHEDLDAAPSPTKQTAGLVVLLGPIPEEGHPLLTGYFAMLPPSVVPKPSAGPLDQHVIQT